jgi:hypothetical protein
VILGELIEALEKLPEDRVLPVGFDKPHSYRGYYNELAFEPAVPPSAHELSLDLFEGGRPAVVA